MSKELKFCPLIYIGRAVQETTEYPTPTCICVEENCALWEPNTGTCSMATLAYLKGREAALSDRIY